MNNVLWKNYLITKTTLPDTMETCITVSHITLHPCITTTIIQLSLSLMDYMHKAIVAYMREQSQYICVVQ